MLELGPRVPPRIIGIADRDRYRSPAAEAFVELAKELCASLDAPAAEPVVAVA